MVLFFTAPNEIEAKKLLPRERKTAILVTDVKLAREHRWYAHLRVKKGECALSYIHKHIFVRVIWANCRVGCVCVCMSTANGNKKAKHTYFYDNACGSKYIQCAREKYGNYEKDTHTETQTLTLYSMKSIKFNDYSWFFLFFIASSPYSKSFVDICVTNQAVIWTEMHTCSFYSLFFISYVCTNTSVLSVASVPFKTNICHLLLIFYLPVFCGCVFWKTEGNIYVLDMKLIHQIYLIAPVCWLLLYV